MNLIIDAGNTSVKLAVFKENELLSVQQAALKEFDSTLATVLNQYPEITDTIVSSVSFEDKDSLRLLNLSGQVIYVDQHLKLPFENHYGSPESLGADRIALAASAVLQYPDKNALILDAGTCITYDLVTEYKCYLGGAISPGLHMRYRALHEYTSRLPLLKTTDIDELIGNTTENSIHSGVINGLCREIDGVIGQYQSLYEHLTVILTGGDAVFLSKRLKKAIFAHSNFLLEGLNFLLEYNKR
ncbi:MAG: type III pantothenate kinase [Flavobacteriaceae bacterium]